MATRFEFNIGDETSALLINTRHFYLLPGGDLLQMQTWPAWCEGCEAFVEAENFPTTDELGGQIREAEYFAEWPGLIPLDSASRIRYMIRNITDSRSRLEWRSTRVSPAKCLDCGSSDLRAIELDRQFDIPGRGRCVACFRGWVDAVTDLPDRYYSREGIRIAEPKAFRSCSQRRA